MYEYKVKEIVKVVDGDTIDVIIDLGFGLFKKERCRVAGIDAPESRTRDLEEKRYGLEAKEWLIDKLTTEDDITIKTEKDGKYGRMLGWISINNVCINSLMIEQGYAWSYYGGSKQKDYSLLEVRRCKSVEVN